MSRSLPAMNCPHCDGPSKIRSSREVTPLYREIYYQCQTLTCSCTFKADLAVICELSPPATPNPRVKLPLGNRPGRGPAIMPPAANDDLPLAANDDAPGEGQIEA